ncbi:MAG: hypothetical protein ACE5FD_03420 [Anaerolineae bacterium]
MLVKRLVLALISLVFGAVVTYGIVYFIGTTPQEYGSTYFFFTMLSLACFLGIWLDKYMGTGILSK